MSQKKDKFENLNKLNTCWNLWYHNPNNNNWELDSYQDFIFFTTIEEFWNIYKGYIEIDNKVQNKLQNKDLKTDQNKDLKTDQNPENNATNYINEFLIQNGMFFMMRDSTKPIWEDDQNCMGGCWSYKVDKKDVYRVWIELSAKIIAEDTVDDEHWDLINGISISPKKTFSIIKIWVSKNIQEIKPNVNDIYILNSADVIYRAHVSNIEKHKTRMKQINAKRNQYKNKKF